MLNQIVLVGRLAGETEIIEAETGKKYIKFYWLCLEVLKMKMENMKPILYRVLYMVISESKQIIGVKKATW